MTPQTPLLRQEGASAGGIGSAGLRSRGGEAKPFASAEVRGAFAAWWDCSVIQAEKEALPHAGVDVIERAWRAVKVGVQGRCVGPEVAADGRCPVEAGLQGFLICLLAV